MTQPPPAIPPPSWLPTILVGSMTVILLQLFTQTALGVTFDSVVAQCAMLCCCAIQPAPIGAFISFLALRRDPALTPGQGFTVAFIASGVGALIVALPQVLDAPSVSERESAVLQQLESVNEQMAPADKFTAQEMQEAAASIAQLMPYVPVVVALVFTVIAGVCGLLTAGYLRGRIATTPPPGQP